MSDDEEEVPPSKPCERCGKTCHPWRNRAGKLVVNRFCSNECIYVEGPIPSLNYGGIFGVVSKK